MEWGDKVMLRELLDIIKVYPDIRGISGSADACRRWARSVGDYYDRLEGTPLCFRRQLLVDDLGCPSDLTRRQAEILMAIASHGFESGKSYQHEIGHLTWLNAFLGRFPHHPKAPSECLNRHFLERYRSEPLYEDRRRYEDELAYPEEIEARRAALEQIEKNRRLIRLLDDCWHICFTKGTKADLSKSTAFPIEHGSAHCATD
jgi:hypothetical protein